MDSISYLFSNAEYGQISGVGIEVYDISVAHEELVQLLRPEIISIYNQFFRAPARPITRARLPRMEAILTQNIPTVRKLKKGEFGEVLATLFAERSKGRFVPVYKHSHKTARNMPFHGMDCVALALDETNSAINIRLYFYEVKTTESSGPYPAVCYHIRDAFQNMNAETFDSEIAFIYRQMQRSATTEFENLVLDLLETVSYDSPQIVFCPFLVVESSRYRSSFGVPFCSVTYEKSLEPVIVRISQLDTAYRQIMENL